jgi:hypothetical protein
MQIKAHRSNGRDTYNNRIISLVVSMRLPYRIASLWQRRLFALAFAAALLAIGNPAGADAQYDEPAEPGSAWSASVDEHDDGACLDHLGGGACSTVTCCAALAPASGAVASVSAGAANGPWSIRTLGRATSVAPPTRPPNPRDPA